MTAPGPASDRAAAAKLAEHEARVRAIATFMWPDDHEDSIALRAVLAELDRCENLAEGWHKHHNEALDARDAARAERDQARAELDRQRELIAAVLAEVDRYERGGDVIMRTSRIRALLEGEER